ncbi:MAG: 30S ribosomal protein S1 [Acidobacteriota bacterium]|nr:30S ribosomal protein S1 [Acidobacteriota bacterium]
MAISQDEQHPGTEPQGTTPPVARATGKQVMKTTSPWGHDDDTDPQEYARLLDLYDNSFRNLAEGEVVKGTVLKVTANEVVIDVGYKSEGVIAVDEFLDETGQVIVREGDVVDVLLERTEDREGHIVLSREKAEKMKIWDEVERAFAERKVVIGRVVERIKGGLAVDIGVRAFLPGSQIDVRPVRNLDALKGQELRMRVIKVNKKRGNIVLSRKVLLEEENAEKKKSTLETLAEGKVLRGVVKNITDYGAFIDLGGIDGLLHITDMSWGRVGHPSELFKVNDEIDVVVLKYDQATERVSLGHKQLMADPWTTVMDRFPAGARMTGKVVSLTDYGAFIELEPGVEGLIHVSEMSWSKRVKHPSKILNVGDPVEAMVLGVDPAARRISLGLKQVEQNPWHELAEKYPVGTRIKGKVRNLTEFGAFVEVEEDIDGLIHVSEFDDSQGGEKIDLEVDKSYQMKIIKLSPAERKIGLSIRALTNASYKADYESFSASQGEGGATLGDHLKHK